MEDIIGWFEIPVSDLVRAKKFYNTILNIDLRDGGFGDEEMAMFPSDMKNVSGALVMGPTRLPNAQGVLIYFKVGEDLDKVLSKVENAGGQIIVAKTLIMPEAGYFGIFMDTEGNNIGLHSMN